jgi:hypothetical protein
MGRSLCFRRKLHFVVDLCKRQLNADFGRPNRGFEPPVDLTDESLLGAALHDERVTMAAI